MDSLIDQQTCCDWELSSELIDPPINQNLLAIRSSYESSLTPWSTDKHVVIRRSYQRSVSPRLTNFKSLIDQQSFCNQELLSELIQSLRKQRASYDRKLSWKLMDFPIDQKLLAIRSSYKSSLTPWSTNKLLGIRSSYQSSLTPWSTNKYVVFVSSYQSSSSPRSTNIESLIDQQTFCNRELLSEFIRSLIEQNTLRDRKPSSELINSLIDWKLFAIRSSYESSLTPWSANKLVVIEGSYKRFLTLRLIRISLQLGARIRAQWLKNLSTTFL